jgi:hypothetical protein
MLEVLFTSQYHKDLLIATATISYGTAIFLTVLLAWKLTQIKSKNSEIVDETIF